MYTYSCTMIGLWQKYRISAFDPATSEYASVNVKCGRPYTLNEYKFTADELIEHCEILKNVIDERIYLRKYGCYPYEEPQCPLL